MSVLAHCLLLIQTEPDLPTDHLWPDGVVSFRFNTWITRGQRDIIFHAIQEITDNSCLQFKLVDESFDGDYILFSEQGIGCVSYGIGRVGGAQLITLPDFGASGTCLQHGIILHLILHALGFIHEQSRPDRDRYVKVNEEYFDDDTEFQFPKVCECSTDSHSVGYDYASIMHYGSYAFSNGTGPTIEVTDQDEHTRQGSPELGQLTGLSQRDILRLNRMYNCPVAQGRWELRVYVTNATGVPYSELSNSHLTGLYASVTAKDECGRSVTKSTSTVTDTQNPVWNEQISFGSSTWRNFKVSIREDISDQSRGNLTRDGGYAREESCYRDNPAVVVCGETTWIESTNASDTFHSDDLTYCIGVDTCVSFAYQVQPSRTPCEPNPCFNGGECVHTFAGFSCKCASGYRGRLCEEEVAQRSCDPSYLCNVCASTYNNMCLEND